MLTALTQEQLEIIGSNISSIINNAFNAYEQTQKRFEISSEKIKYKSLYIDLISNILNRISEEKPFTIIPLYDKISFTLVGLDFNISIFIQLLEYSKRSIFAFSLVEGGRNIQLEDYIDRYVDKIISDITQDRVFQKGLASDQLIQLVKEYAPSFVLEREEFLEDKIADRVIHPLIPEDLYWEYQKEQYKDNSSFSTRRITIYNKKVYSLNQNVQRPSIYEFNKEEWSEYNSKYLFKKDLFLNKLRNNAEVYVSSALSNSSDINGAISDSKIQSINSSIAYDEKDLERTFAGRGKSILSNILSLKTTISYFGGYQGSPIGDVNFIASFCESFYACLYGRVTGKLFASFDGVSLFGKFNELFLYEDKTNRIAGLEFLNKFASLKSFKQKIKLPSDLLLEEKRSNNKIKISTYNPIYAKYANGIEDKYVYARSNPYIEEADVDIILFGLERLLDISNNIGDILESLKSILDKNGNLPGYEGYGSISIQIEELRAIFVSTKEIEENYSLSEIKPGLNGVLSYLLSSYKRLSDVLYEPPFTSESLRSIAAWANKIQSNLERIVSVIESIGFLPNSFVPNLSFKFFTSERETLVDQLKSLNFQDSEIEQFLSSETFEELLLKFAPITDAADQISFFRAYELSQLIYEFGGESAIDSYISYLYEQNSDNLTNILNFATKNKTSGVIFNESRYGKLIGLLANLTYAIDPDQLEIFKDYLSGNYLDLFESISFLLQNRDTNILLDKEDINLLRPITDSLIYGRSPFGIDSMSINYDIANDQVPIALKQWTDLIGSNLGSASTNLIQNLLSKSLGLTPRELISILNTTTDHNHNEYGQLIDGYSGGRLTKIINYSYLSGILHKLSYYSNSYQPPNFFISPNNTFNLSILVGTVKNLINLLNLTSTNFVNSLDYKLGQDDVNLYSFDNFVNAQNKNPEELFKLIKEIVPIDKDLTNLGVPTINGLSELTGAPGTGNSPVPESLAREGSITPEQANLLSPQIKQNFSFIANSSNKNITSSEIINKFIRFTEENRTTFKSEINNSILKPGDSLIVEANANILKDKTLSTKKDSVLTDADKSSEVIISDLYNKEPLQDTIIASEVDNLIKEKLISKFDLLESCKRFGGDQCDSRINNSVNTCGSPINRAVYSQRDESSYSPLTNGSVLIDRPYGSFAEFKPKELFLPYSKNNKPAYFSLLDKTDQVKIGDKGSPIRSEINSQPLIFKKDDSEDESLYSSYYNSEYGLIEAIKAEFEKDTPFKCSLLEDPYAYMACMNLLKCKRFKRGEGANSLSFCPKTLAGGTFK